jgi:archaeosine-15-forming tRNA-guanine transglycosylase
MDSTDLLYSRDLPGGGRVTIEAHPAGSPDAARCRARVIVERRRDPQRREGHAPPVIVEAEAPTRARAYDELVVIASDNVAVARGLIQWQSRRGRKR